MHRDIVPLFRDVDVALSGDHRAQSHRAPLLQNALAASRAQADHQQAEDTRRISAWVAIGVVPTIIAGLFGMNLGGIPGSDHLLGFGIVTVLTLAVCVYLYRQFKKADWL